MHAAAFRARSVRAIVEAGRDAVPAGTSYRAMIEDVLRWHRRHPRDWKATWRRLERRWNAHTLERQARPAIDSEFNIDAKLNGAYILLGLLYGGGDFERSIRISMRAGQDTDCNPANAASIIGTWRGCSGLPKRFRARARATGDSFSFTDYTLRRRDRGRRFAVARELTLLRGGGVSAGTAGRPRADPVVAPAASSSGRWLPTRLPQLHGHGLAGGRAGRLQRERPGPRRDRAATGGRSATSGGARSLRRPYLPRPRDLQGDRLGRDGLGRTTARRWTSSCRAPEPLSIAIEVFTLTDGGQTRRGRGASASPASSRAPASRSSWRSTTCGCPIRWARSSPTSCAPRTSAASRSACSTTSTATGPAALHPPPADAARDPRGAADRGARDLRRPRPDAPQVRRPRRRGRLDRLGQLDDRLLVAPGERARRSSRTPSWASASRRNFAELWEGRDVERSGFVEPDPLDVGGAGVRAWFTPGHGEELSQRIATLIGGAASASASPRRC